jgi:hypothetical protein
MRGVEKGPCETILQLYEKMVVCEAAQPLDDLLPLWREFSRDIVPRKWNNSSGVLDLFHSAIGANLEARTKQKESFQHFEGLVRECAVHFQFLAMRREELFDSRIADGRNVNGVRMKGMCSHLFEIAVVNGTDTVDD